MTDTSGDAMNLASRLVRSALSCLGVTPAACTSSSSGREILPSGRTGTVRLRPALFHTVTSRMSSGPIVYSFVGAGGAARELPVPSPSAAAATAAPAHRVHIAAPPRDPFATDSWVRLPNRTTTIGVEPRWVPLGESPIRRRRFPVAAGRALPEIRRGRANDETLTASLTARSA